MTYRITIDKGLKGSWSFRYIGRLKWWQRALIELAGWEITEIHQATRKM